MSTRTCKLRALLALSLVSMGGHYPLAQSQTATSSLSVTATVGATCTVTTAPVAFSTYDPTASTVNDVGVGTVTVTCTNGTTYSIALGAGSNFLSSRRMVSATAPNEYLNYDLYQETLRTTIWGDGSAHGSVRAGLTGTGSSQNYSVFGRIPANQYVKPDTYSDTVVVTVTY